MCRPRRSDAGISMGEPIPVATADASVASPMADAEPAPPMVAPCPPADEGNLIFADSHIALGTAYSRQNKMEQALVNLLVVDSRFLSIASIFGNIS